MTDRGERVYYKSTTDCWETPQELFDRLNAKYHFELDVCADKHNAKCERYYTKEQDGLKQEWSGSCWMNPPYGRKISLWMKKAYEASLNGATVVCLVPARTDTAWWHDWAVKGTVEFVRGRLKFGGQKNNAPFPSAIIVFCADGKKSPTIDAVPVVHAKWLYDRPHHYKCSDCKSMWGELMKRMARFCPNCGAKMDGGSDMSDIAQKAPAVKAAPVVRCKDCKHRGKLYECPMRHIESSEGGGTRVVDATKDEGYCDRGCRDERNDAEPDGTAR